MSLVFKLHSYEKHSYERLNICQYLHVNIWNSIYRVVTNLDQPRPLKIISYA